MTCNFFYNTPSNYLLKLGKCGHVSHKLLPAILDKMSRNICMNKFAIYLKTLICVSFNALEINAKYIMFLTCKLHSAITFHNFCLLC